MTDRLARAGRAVSGVSEKRGTEWISGCGLLQDEGGGTLVAAKWLGKCRPCQGALPLRPTSQRFHR